MSDFLNTPKTVLTQAASPLEYLLRARLWVARLGEGDVLKWWQTEAVLGPDGAFVGPRVLPKTHAVGRARLAFAAARYACDERYPHPGATHLFRLDASTEDQFEGFLHATLDDSRYWEEILGRLEALGPDCEPGQALAEAGLVDEDLLSAVSSLDLGPDSRSLGLQRAPQSESDLALLTAGFARGRTGRLVVPYIADKEPGARG